jgi:hypothetical protein
LKKVLIQLVGFTVNDVVVLKNTSYWSEEAERLSGMVIEVVHGYGLFEADSCGDLGFAGVPA